MAFVLDSNVFIEAHRTTYPLDIAIGFWDTITRLASDGQIISIDKVHNEILRNEDELSDWLDSNLPRGFFRDTLDPDVLKHYGTIVTWAESRADHYKRRAIDEFMEFARADAWLVAYCRAFNHELVTQEVSKTERKNAIPIPQACIAQEVTFCNTIEMLRKIGVRF